MYQARALIALVMVAGLATFGMHHMRLNLCHVGPYRWHASSEPCGEPEQEALAP
ncbi:hypothetical protein HUK83_16880 [Endobacter medicaginis]|uniref:Uncharacterized protein n=1 Tax=Endobacter medicaginis TaxID=1181271 RepID=A0A850NX21_9PROT|nr:hypothetical protein [Endobacter medicaginis]MCX5474224.1 hypothetical protein [Endobacter medicaginis]NVN32002.1 hypothetical protein [Endobacter medicaginis]